MIKNILNLTKILFSKYYRALSPIGYAKYIGVKVGKNCRLLSVDFGSEPYLISLGDHVSATQTKFITHDGAVWVLRDKYFDEDIIAPIKVGNNVFLGLGTIVLPGVTIGDNVIIGAGSVVTKNIPPNSVALGTPARVIKTIEEYELSAKPKFIKTKTMDYKTKRKYLLSLQTFVKYIS